MLVISSFHAVVAVKPNLYGNVYIFRRSVLGLFGI